MVSCSKDRSRIFFIGETLMRCAPASFDQIYAGDRCLHPPRRLGVTPMFDNYNYYSVYARKLLLVAEWRSRILDSMTLGHLLI